MANEVKQRGEQSPPMVDVESSVPGNLRHGETEFCVQSLLGSSTIEWSTHPTHSNMHFYPTTCFNLNGSFVKTLAFQEVWLTILLPYPSPISSRVGWTAGYNTGSRTPFSSLWHQFEWVLRSMEYFYSVSVHLLHVLLEGQIIHPHICGQRQSRDCKAPTAGEIAEGTGTPFPCWVSSPTS